MNKKHRIAYIMSRFPGLSETFILREMCELERQGLDLELYPLIFQHETVVHEDAKDWIERAHRPSLAQILLTNIKWLVTHPLVYIHVFLRVFFGNLTSVKFLTRAIILYPKAVWMADQMKVDNVAHVHAHYATHPTLVAWVINKLVGIPYSVTTHAHDIFVDRSMLHKKMYDAVFIVTISRFNREFLINCLGSWVGEKITVVHCGIIPGLYTKYSDTKKLGASHFDIISIGSLRPYKGFAYLLDACNILRQRGLLFRCRIIGGGELSAILYSRIQELNLHGLVELLGPKDQKEVAQLLKDADCYVQPSIITATGKMEGIPVSLMEAMASEVPVVATNISGISELVQPNQTGYLVPPENSLALAEAIIEIHSDPKKAKYYAYTGKALVLKEFDLSTNVTLLSNLFRPYLEDLSWK